MPLPGVFLRDTRPPAAGAEDVHRRLRLRHGDAVPQPRLDEERGSSRAALEHARRALPIAGSAVIGSQKSVTTPMLSVPR